MELSTQKLIHTFGALADLGQEIAGRGDFSEMVRTSMHLLLGTLALRRGAVAECIDQGELRCVALWGLEPRLFTNFSIAQSDKNRSCASRTSRSRVAVNANSLIIGYSSYVPRLT